MAHAPSQNRLPAALAAKADAVQYGNLVILDSNCQRGVIVMVTATANVATASVAHARSGDRLTALLLCRVGSPMRPARATITAYRGERYLGHVTETFA